MAPGQNSASSIVRVLLFAVAAVATSSGCDGLLGRNQAQCDQSVATVRQAISFRQLESAEQWREYTWKICRDEELLATIDKELIAAREAVALEKLQAAKREREVAQARINAAQALWMAFDARKESERTTAQLTATRSSAIRQGKGLGPDLAKQLDSYNSAQFAKRQALLKR